MPGDALPAPAPSPEPTPAPAAVPASDGTPPDRDTLVEAWGDHILRTLPARVAVSVARRARSAEIAEESWR